MRQCCQKRADSRCRLILHLLGFILEEWSHRGTNPFLLLLP